MLLLRHIKKYTAGTRFGSHFYFSRFFSTFILRSVVRSLHRSLLYMAFLHLMLLPFLLFSLSLLGIAGDAVDAVVSECHWFKNEWLKDIDKRSTRIAQRTMTTATLQQQGFFFTLLFNFFFPLPIRLSLSLYPYLFTFSLFCPTLQNCTEHTLTNHAQDTERGRENKKKCMSVFTIAYACEMYEKGAR